MINKINSITVMKDTPIEMNNIQKYRFIYFLFIHQPKH